MSFDVTTLALAKSYTDQHSGGGDGASTAEKISYTNTDLPDVANVKTALDKVVKEQRGHGTDIEAINDMLGTLYKKSHSHTNKDTLDNLSVLNGKLQYNGSDVGLKGDKGDTPVKGTDYWTAADKQEIIDDIHPVYYIDLTGTYPNYTCPVAMDDITAAYNAGYNLVCRCTLGAYTATLPLFVPMPVANTWIFSGSGALKSMDFAAQSFTVAIAANGVVAQNVALSQQLHITVGDTTYTYDGSLPVDIDMDGVTPTIGDNGNWYIGTTDTGKPSRGEKGDKGEPGAAGKSAYQYAVEGGYIGTETEFAEKLTSGAMIVTITDNNGTLSAGKSFMEIWDAIFAGTPVYVWYDGSVFPLVGIADSLLFGAIQCANDDRGAIIATPMIEITENNEVNDLSAQLDIPTTLPNPHAITFTGAVTGSYDGSNTMTVNIPSAVTDEHINSLIDTKLGVIENGSY